MADGWLSSPCVLVWSSLCQCFFFLIHFLLDNIFESLKNESVTPSMDSHFMSRDPESAKLWGVAGGLGWDWVGRKGSNKTNLKTQGLRLFEFKKEVCLRVAS